EHRTLAGVAAAETGGTGDGHVVTAIVTLAAAAAIHKQVIVVAVAGDIRSFNTLVVATVDVGHAAGQLTGALIDLRNAQSPEERTVGHVNAAIMITEQRRIDGIDLAGATIRANHDTQILPAGIFQRRRPHQPNSGVG